MIGRLRTLAGRVERMTRDRAVAGASDERLISWYCQMQLEEAPWLMTIEPADADPGTYAAIQATIVRARGTDGSGAHREVRALPQAGCERRRGETDRDWFIRRMGQISGEVRSQSDACRRAHAAAAERKGSNSGTGGATTRILR